MRNSFLDILRDLKLQFPNIHWFLPANNLEPYVDATLKPVAIAPHFGLGKRQVDLVANTGKVCLSERNIVERSFARCHNSKLSGNSFPLSHQLTEPSGSPPTPEVPKIEVWLDVMPVMRRRATPYCLA